MSTLIVCDCCGKAVNKYDSTHLIIKNPLNPDDCEFDLCYDCFHYFTTWMFHAESKDDIPTKYWRTRTKARFIGEDGSLGLRHGSVYTIWITDRKPYDDKDGYWVEIDKFFYTQSCPYDTASSFFKNWKFVEE